MVPTTARCLLLVTGVGLYSGVIQFEEDQMEVFQLLPGCCVNGWLAGGAIHSDPQRTVNEKAGCLQGNLLAVPHRRTV